MTEARARVLAPEVDTGLAVSTTSIHGDCRPRDEDPSPPRCDGEVGALCVRGRAALRVQVVPVNVSVPLSRRCGRGAEAGALAALAAADGWSSAGGELVLALAAGRYTVHVSEAEGCAYCGSASSGETCEVDVESGRVSTRDLVLDRATH